MVFSYSLGKHFGNLRCFFVVTRTREHYWHLAGRDRRCLRHSSITKNWPVSAQLSNVPPDTQVGKKKKNIFKITCPRTQFCIILNKMFLIVFIYIEFSRKAIACTSRDFILFCWELYQELFKVMVFESPTHHTWIIHCACVVVRCMTQYMRASIWLLKSSTVIMSKHITMHIILL